MGPTQPCFPTSLTQHSQPVPRLREFFFSEKTMSLTGKGVQRTIIYMTKMVIHHHRYTGYPRRWYHGFVGAIYIYVPLNFISPHSILSKFHPPVINRHLDLRSYTRFFTRYQVREIHESDFLFL